MDLPGSPDGWRLVPVGDVVLETAVAGSGPPVLWIQTALTADELVPAAGLVAATGRYRSIVVHRRGYGASSPSDGDGSVDRDARDHLAVLDALGAERAHVVGASYSAAVALRLAAEAPERVATLCLLEPPPLGVAAEVEFRAACAELLDDCGRLGAPAAADRFLARLAGPDWARDLDRHLPGVADQVARDAASFFADDLPALLAWDPLADPPAVTAPALHVGGAASGNWFTQVRRRVLEVLPGAEDVVLDGADHSLAITHAPALADAVTGFLDRHPSAPAGRHGQ